MMSKIALFSISDGKTSHFYLRRARLSVKWRKCSRYARSHYSPAMHTAVMICFPLIMPIHLKGQKNGAVLIKQTEKDKISLGTCTFKDSPSPFTVVFSSLSSFCEMRFCPITPRLSFWWTGTNVIYDTLPLYPGRVVLTIDQDINTVVTTI